MSKGEELKSATYRRMESVLYCRAAHIVSGSLATEREYRLLKTIIKSPILVL